MLAAEGGRDARGRAPISTDQAAPARSRPAASADEPRQLPTHSLDAVRGAAAAYVMLFHARGYLFIGAGTVGAARLHGPFLLAILAGALVRYGHVAVLAFFLVSGYAIHYRQARRLAADGVSGVSWRRYALHRFRRIYPPLCLALLLTLLLDAIMLRFAPSSSLGDIGPDAFIGALLFVQGFAAPVLTTNQPLWSLAYEGFFYATYPVVLAANRRLGPARCLLLFVLVGLACALLNGSGARLGLLWPMAYWPAWAAGAFIADARVGRARVPDAWWRRAAVGGVLLLAVVAVTAGASSTVGVNSNNRYSYADLLWVPGLFGPLGWLIAARHSPRAYARLLRLCAPLLGLGAISYSLYLVHFPVVLLFHQAWLAAHPALPSTPWLLMAGVSAALLVAAAVYWLAERPFLSAERRGVARPGRPTPVAVAPAGAAPARSASGRQP